jgi:molybdopterin/thiamine biosynthesis adenylyltransferase
LLAEVSVQYFFRTSDVRKERRALAPIVKRLYPDVACAALGQAIDQAKQTVLASDRTLMLQSDACARNRNGVQTKYRCWIDERGGFNEITLG